MTEEQVTKTILTALILNNWDIISYDFPQSGTGMILRPNSVVSEKNKGGIIPDIIAIKDGTCLFFENKQNIALSDFHKTSALITNNQFTNDISSLLCGYDVTKIYYGIGFPSDKWNKTAEENTSLVDFVLGVTCNNIINFYYNPFNILL